MKPAANGTMPPIAAVRLPLACRGSRRRLVGGRAARCRVIWDGGARTSVAREDGGSVPGHLGWWVSWPYRLRPSGKSRAGGLAFMNRLKR